MDMKRRTSSSHLKARLGQYMKAVRAGEEIVVTDRDLPVARLVPYVVRDGEASEAVPVAVPRDPGAPPLGKVDVKPIRYRGRPTTELLEADRSRR
jgi:prevent-host-death family protein